MYNTLLYLDPGGQVADIHRKLMPTGGERTVWGQGDGSTLTVADTGFGRVGGLLCWENLMPLARAAMYQQGIDIYVAPTWDNSDAANPRRCMSPGTARRSGRPVSEHPRRCRSRMRHDPVPADLDDQPFRPRHRIHVLSAFRRCDHDSSAVHYRSPEGISAYISELLAELGRLP